MLYFLECDETGDAMEDVRGVGDAIEDLCTESALSRIPRIHQTKFLRLETRHPMNKPWNGMVIATLLPLIIHVMD